MKKTIVIISTLCLFQFLMTSCKKENIAADNFTINYSKNSSWINYSYKASINQNNKLTINENNELSNIHRTSEYLISDSEMTILKTELKSIEKINIANEYGFTNPNAPTDLPVIKFQYQTKEVLDSTSVYYPDEDEMPNQLKTFLITVENLIIKTDTLKEN